VEYIDIELALGNTSFDLGNKILYDLCYNNPLHDNGDVIIAKIWLIWRAYSAAIERGKHPNEKKFSYVENVVPKFLNYKDANGKKIDDWLKPLREKERNKEKISENNMYEMVAVHKKIIEMFYEISGKDNRSLASKYLHFHFPSLFFIYDSRARIAMIQLGTKSGNKSTVDDSNTDTDRKYFEFYSKCLRLQASIEAEHKKLLSPKEIDKLLLYVYKKEK
jgi:hypothetical protein